MILAVTGYREYADVRFIRSYLGTWKSMYLCSSMTFLHVRVGDAEGADDITVKWCEDNDVSHHKFKAKRFASGALMPGEGPARNHRMLLGIGDPVSGPTSLLVGFPRTDGVRITVPGSGTWGCMIKAFELGIKVEVPPYAGPGVR
jgi:hypothetical protein